MKVSVAALRKVLQAQLAAIEGRTNKEREKAIIQRKTELKDAVARGERYVKRAKELLAADGADCLAELNGLSTLYGDRYRNGEVGNEVRRAIKLLDLSATDELTLADATRLVGKSLIEAL